MFDKVLKEMLSGRNVFKIFNIYKQSCVNHYKLVLLLTIICLNFIRTIRGLTN